MTWWAGTVTVRTPSIVPDADGYVYCRVEARGPRPLKIVAKVVTTARADVTVEAGKLTEATLSHAAAKVTFKLVMRAGGEAMADTQWSVTTLRGEPIKDSVGALPTHILAPGSYTALARHSGQQFRRDFSVRAGDVVQVELVMP